MKQVKSEMLIEAESFSELGGWKLDTQFVDIMGSPYLLAHGLGKPVENAKTTINLPEAGKWYIWVRTKNWVPGGWEAPGRFNLLINGSALDHEFGAASDEWGWEKGGAVTLESATVELELEDLTGFDGRCDALFLTRNVGEIPNNSSEVMSAWRRKHSDIAEVREEKEFDLVVVGGGLAGTSAAIAASRMGLSVALIQNRPVLGGNGSAEIRVAPRGKFPAGNYPQLSDIVREISPWINRNVHLTKEFEHGDKVRQNVVEAEPSLHLFLNHHAYRVEMNGKRIEAVWAFDTRGRCVRRFSGKYVVDATGHGTIGLKAGADYVMDSGSRMGASNLWHWRFGDKDIAFTEAQWALSLDKNNFPYPSEGNVGKGEWYWESGFTKHPLKDLEKIRDHNLRAVFGAWNAMKNHEVYASRDKSGKKHKTAELLWVAYISGTRETLQILGDVILSKDDIVSKRSFPDSCVPATWGMDLHYPLPVYAKEMPDNPFISRAHFGGRVDDSKGSLATSATHFVHSADGKSYDRNNGYMFPYRSFYSRNIENLFTAGRDISVTHEALGTVRVMNTLGMVGVVVGRAAAIAVKHDATPRGVYENHLGELKKVLAQPGEYRPSQR